MSGSNTDATITIRAKDLSSQPMKEVIATLTQLTASIDAQSRMADRGEGSLNNLKRGATNLEQGLSALLNQRSAIEKFLQLQAQLGQAKGGEGGVADFQGRLDAARADRDNLQNGLAKYRADAGAKPSDIQKAGIADIKASLGEAAERVKALEKEERRAEAAVKSLESALERQGSKLQAIGVDSTKTSAAISDLNNAISRTTAAMGANNEATSNFALNKQRANAISEEAARIAGVEAAALANLAKQEEIDYEARLRNYNFEQKVNAARLKDVDLRRAEAAELLKFRAAAGEAMTSAPKLSPFGESGAAPQSFKGAADSLLAIQNPALAARASLQGVAEEIRVLVAYVDAGRLPIEKFAEAQKSLSANAASLRGFAGLLDDYKKQEAATLATEAAYNKAAAGLERLDRQMVAAIAPSDELTRELAMVKADTDRAAAAFEKQNAALTALRAVLKEAGLDYNNINGEIAKVTATAGRGVGAVSKLSDELERQGLAAFQKKAIDTQSTAPQIGAVGSAAGSQRFNDAATLLQSIQNPAALARASLAGVEAEINKLATGLQTGKLTIDRYNAAMQVFAAGAQSLRGLASLIDDFKRQEAATKSAEDAYLRNEQALSTMTIAMLKQAAPSAAMAAEQARLAKAVADSAAAFGKENQALGDLKVKLHDAKIDTNDLNGALSQIASTASKSNIAADGLKKAFVASGGQKGEVGFLGLRGYELTNLSYQLNDVFTQLGSGTPIMQVFAQQAGQVFQIFQRQLGGLLPYLKYIGPAAIAAAAAILVLYKAAQEAALERAFDAKLKATADASEYTARQLSDATHALKSFGAGATDAAAAVDIFVKSGIKPELLATFGKTAQNLADVYGIKLPEAAKAVTNAFTGGYDAVVKLDKEYGFLTAAQDAQIRSLFEQGRVQEAQTLAFGIYQAKLELAGRTIESGVTKAVRDLKTAFDDLFTTLARSDALKNILDQLSGIVNLARNIIQLSSGEISGPNFVKRLQDASNGRTAQTAKEEQLADLDRKKTTVEAQGRIYGVGDLANAKDDASNPNNARIQELKKSLSEVIAEIATLKGSGELARYRSELESLERRRDALKADPKAVANAPKVDTTSNPGVPESYTRLRDQVADRVGIDREALARVQRHEGIYENGAFVNSPSGVRGPLQVTGNTFEGLRARHPEIGTNINDLETNTLAGALYLKELLGKVNGNLAEAYKLYNGVPKEYAKAIPAIHNGVSIGGYTGNALQPQDLGQTEARIAEVKKVLGETGAAAADAGRGVQTIAKNTDGLTAANERNRVSNQRVAKDLQDANQAFQDNNLHGKEAIDQQAARIAQFRENLLSATQSRVEGGILDFETLAQIQIKVNQEDAKLTKEREERDRAYFERKRTALQAITDFENSIKAKVDTFDKTDAAARRRAIDEQTARDKGVIAKALAEKVITPEKATDILKGFDSIRDKLKEQVTLDANGAILDKLKAEYHAITEKITADYASGIIDTPTFFRRLGEELKTYTPKINDAKNKALADLRAFGGATPTPQIAAAIAKTEAFRPVDPKAQLGEYNKGFGELEALNKARQETVKTQDELVAKGLQNETGREAAIKRSFDLTKQASESMIGTLQTQLEYLRSIQAITPAVYDEMSAKLKLVAADAQYVSRFEKELLKTFENSVLNNAVQAFDTIGQAIGNFAAGTGKLKDVFASLGQAAGQFAAGVLKDVAQMIIKYELLKLVQSTLGIGGSANGANPTGESGGADAGGIFAKLFKMGASYASGGLTNIFDGAVGGEQGLFGGGGQSGSSFKGGSGAFGSDSGGVTGDEFNGAGTALTTFNHYGGVIGMGSARMSRLVDASLFANAPRFHSGNVVGLQPDEQAAILQHGEEVLNKGDPRNVLNGGKSAKAAPSSPASLKQVLVFNERDIAQATAGSHGEDVFITHVKNNAQAVKSIIG